MAATICVRNIEATLDDTMVWHCENKTTEALLQAILQDWEARADYAPNPCLSAARAAAEALGGELLRYDEVPFDTTLVY